jgi:hypothetical protein
MAQTTQRSRRSAREFYLARLEAEIRGWEGTLHTLERRLRALHEEVRPRFASELNAMRVTYLGVATSVRGLQGTGEEVWETVRPQIEQTWKACRQQLRKLDEALRRAAEPRRAL